MILACVIVTAIRDDPSTNVQQYYYHLVNVLNHFRVHNLCLKATKCHFGVKSV